MGCGLGRLLHLTSVDKKWASADNIPELKASVSELKNALKEVKQNAEKKNDSRIDMNELNKCYKKLKQDCDSLVKKTVKFHINHYGKDMQSIRGLGLYNLTKHTNDFHQAQGKALNRDDVMNVNNAATGVFSAIKKCTVTKAHPGGVDVIEFQNDMKNLAKKFVDPNRGEHIAKKGPDVLY